MAISPTKPISPIDTAPAALRKHLNSGQALSAIYTLHGEEILLLQEALAALRHRMREAGYSERSSHSTQDKGFDWSVIQAEMNSPSLFAERKILEIHIPSGKPGKEGGQALQNLAAQVQRSPEQPPLTLPIVILGRLDKASKNTAWFGALEQAGPCIQLDTIERQQLAPWLAARLALHGLHLAPGEPGQQALAFLCARVQGNLLAAHQEVEKLALLFPEQTLNLEQVQTSVSDVSRYNVFHFGPALLRGQPPAVMQMLEGLRQEGVAEVLVHWSVSEEILQLKRVADAMQTGKPLSMALREQRIWGEREQLYSRLLPTLRPGAIGQLVQAAHICDGIVKGILHPDWPVRPWQALHRLVLLFLRHTKA